MRLDLSQLTLVYIIAIFLFVQEIKANIFCGLLNTCPTSSEVNIPPPATTTIITTTAAPQHTSSSTSTAPPTTTSESLQPSSSVTKPTTPSSSIQHPAKPTPSSSTSRSLQTDASSNIPSATGIDSTSTLPSATASSSPDTKSSSSGSNIGVIVGSVCGFVALIGAGFAYAFFSKTRRNNRRNNKRLYSENGDAYDHDPFHADPFSNTRLSPALATAPAVVADDIHKRSNTISGKQWDMMNQQSYNNYNNATMMSPQHPMSALPKQNEAYYTSPQMTYAMDPNAAYYNNQHAYYDPNGGYQQYDAQYTTQYPEPQYDPYAVQQTHMMTPMMNTSSAVNTTVLPAVTQPTNSTVYQIPNTYDETEKPAQLAPTSAHTISTNNITNAPMSTTNPQHNQEMSYR